MGGGGVKVILHQCNFLPCTIFQYPTMCICEHLPHSCIPMGCTVHAKWCAAQFQGCTHMSIPFVYAPYVCWKFGVCQNVTPDFKGSCSVGHIYVIASMLVGFTAKFYWNSTLFIFVNWWRLTFGYNSWHVRASEFSLAREIKNSTNRNVRDTDVHMGGLLEVK